MSNMQEELPPDFHARLKICQQAERDTWACLARHRTAPTQITRLAIDAAWTAFEVSLGVLESWLLTHPRTIVASAIGDAQKALEEVRIQIERAGLLEVWGRELPRH
jgi:hypothetical protein